MRDAWEQDRIVVVARELTKVHEQIVRGPLSRMIEVIAGQQIQGEVTIISAGWAPIQNDNTDASSMEREIHSLMEGGKLGMKEIAAAVAQMYGVSKRRVYRVALGIRAGEGGREEPQ